MKGLGSSVAILLGDCLPAAHYIVLQWDCCVVSSQFI